jgi:outer membrane protein insertion porin family
VNRNGFEARDGGTEEWLSTIELVVPIQGLDEGLRAVVFADIGNVWGEGDHTDLGELRYAAGVGLRFPRAFPVAIDFAWLLDREDGEDATQFHFTLAGIQF